MMNERGGRLVLGISIAGSCLMVLLGRRFLPVPDVVFAAAVIALCLYSAPWFAEASKREVLYRMGEFVSEVVCVAAMYWIFREEIDASWARSS